MPLFIAGAEKCRRRWIVGGADGIEPGVFEHPDFSLLDGIQRDRAGRAVFVMHACAFQLQRHTVHRKPALRAQRKCTDAEANVICIKQSVCAPLVGTVRMDDDRTRLGHGCLAGVKIWSIAAPELWIAYRKLLIGIRTLPAPQRQRDGSLRCAAARCIEELNMHTYRFLSSTFIFYERTDTDAGFRKISSVPGLRIAAGGGIYRFDPEAVWLDVYGIHCAKIHVPIDPGTGIPACAVRNMDAHKNLILSSILEKAAGFDIKRHVTIVLAYSRRLLLATYAHQVMYAAGLGCAEKGTGNFLCGRSLMGDTTSCDYVGYTSPEGQRLLAAYLQRATPEKHTGEYSPHISENKAECLANSTRQTVRVDADIAIPPGGEVMIASPHGVAGAVKVRELLPDGTLCRKPHEKKNKV